MDDNNLIIELEGVTFGHPGRPNILEGLRFVLHRGDRVGLMGHNGSGKTTFFHVIMGLLKPSSGEIKLFGRPVETEKDFRRFRQKIGLLFQDADDQLFSPTVIEDVAFGPLNAGKSPEEAVLIARKTLKLLGLEEFEDRVTHRLSGGEKRLASLATVLAMEPEALLFDEPTANLDEKTKDKLLDVLRNLDLSYILISHELDFLTDTTDAVFKLEKGKILLDETVRVHPHFHAHSHGTYPHEHHQD
jgi:cobalt/nickel transport system ATP-binding protein